MTNTSAGGAGGFASSFLPQPTPATRKEQTIRTGDNFSRKRCISSLLAFTVFLQALDRENLTFWEILRRIQVCGLQPLKVLSLTCKRIKLQGRPMDFCET